jgi:alpha-D-ribose 1-methylphosphonate 5-triphosphate diphosphatase
MIPLPPMTLSGAKVLKDGHLATGSVGMAEGLFSDPGDGRVVDLSGYLVLPGIVDLHGDGFERHVAPRRGAMKDIDDGILATEAELAANGITTGVLAQFYSWEGGLRGPDFAEQVLRSIARVNQLCATDLIGQLRFEVNLVDDYACLADGIADWGVRYVVFNDHLQHDRLAEGRRPKQLTGQALKAGRSPDVHLALLQGLHARRCEVAPKLDALCTELRARGVRMGSHDDTDPSLRATWRARGVDIAEFPETLSAAEAARADGVPVILGAPNVVRGGSHKGNMSAFEAIALGYCDALASDYHYPSLRRAVLFLTDAGVLDFAHAWALVSEGPARVLGLSDRGRIAPGLRADAVILDATTRRIAATLSGGVVTYMSGAVAGRFLGGHEVSSA